MRGADFLPVATFLQALKTEASLPTQTGRVYYAAYLEARRWCEVHLGYKRERFGREHAEVARLLTRFDLRLSDDLAFLRTYRNTADYDLEISVETLIWQLEDARVRAEPLIARLEILTPPGASAP